MRWVPGGDLVERVGSHYFCIGWDEMWRKCYLGDEFLCVLSVLVVRTLLVALLMSIGPGLQFFQRFWAS